MSQTINGEVIVTPSDMAKASIKILLKYIGENPDREGLKDTPLRMISAWEEMLSGYRADPKLILKRTFTEGACDEMVVVPDIEFTSFCEHHWLPFTGVAHVGYLPDKKVVGLSKIPRLVDCYAKRLQIQEKMGTQITEAIMEHLGPKGCGCVIIAKHSCMSCRGAKKQKARMITSALRGVFKQDASTRYEFLQLLRMGL
jgi:GTP cyclohydrolase I